jgi:hypothetical protein
MFSWRSSLPNRRFPPPRRVEQAGGDCHEIRNANGFRLASVHCRDDPQKWSFGHSHLTSDEARRIAAAIARLPELLMQRRGFHPRGCGERWKPSRPYHVALEDSYVRARWDEINALCKLNSIPFNATGEKIRDEGLWCVYKFTWQMDAILFWDRFEGRWLRGSEIPLP